VVSFSAGLALGGATARAGEKTISDFNFIYDEDTANCFQIGPEEGECNSKNTY
jgi:hypothetical protein